MPTETAARPAAPPLSVVDLFTIGVGPSSSHTVGPMRAALAFAAALRDMAGRVAQLTVTLYGSLALTGRGHATDAAVLVGLTGWSPEEVEPDAMPGIVAAIHRSGTVVPREGQAFPFDPATDLEWKMRTFLPGHPNGVDFTARMEDGRSLSRRFYSIGGGAIVEDGAAPLLTNLAVPYPFASGEELLAIAAGAGLRIDELVRANEAAWRTPAETDRFIDDVRQAMARCIDRGCLAEGILPGGLGVRRRARAMRETLIGRGPRPDASAVFDWVSLWALAVNEENAAGGRVVTAPTNGAAGVIPAVLRYYETFVHGASDEGARRFLYTASAIGFLYKTRASISAAEMGCQGEVGVACSMAAAGLAAVLGGSNAQIENAAEIGMEHNLGLTCDPVGGLVQIPCIERNTMGAIKAINAAQLALHGNGSHIVSLDAVIETMRQTGEDMRSKYKETSLGGLAVNVVEC